MLGSILDFVQANVLWTLLIVAGLFIAILVLKAIARLLVIALLIAGFMYLYNTYTPNIEDAGVALLKDVKGTAVEEGVNLLVSNTDSLVVDSADGVVTLKTSGVDLKWVEGSEKATLGVRGVSTEIEVTDELKNYIVGLQTK